jgi:hypothetical protein
MKPGGIDTCEGEREVTIEAVKYTLALHFPPAGRLRLWIFIMNKI